MRFIFFLFLLCLGFKPIYAQDSFAEKMRWLAKAKPTCSFYVHFDKNVYTNNEVIYFTGYLIKEGITKVKDHQLMSICLIRDLDSAIIIQDKFVMGKD